MGNELDADLISGACPESISDHPKLALSWLSQFACFLRFHFPTFLFRKKSQTPIMTPKPRPQAKSYFIWFSSYHLSPEKVGTYGFSLRIFRFHCFSRALTSEKLQKHLFHFKPSRIYFKETLFQTGTPCRVHSNCLDPGFSDLFWTWGNLAAEAGGTGWPALGEPAGAGSTTRP